MILESTEEHYKLLKGLCFLEEIRNVVSIDGQMMDIENHLYNFVKEQYRELEELEEYPVASVL
ncbi:hypothetical protein [Bacillus taeanensis]|uniref:Uncharacterized protein n=1 Tax=Bacillus taeanensis TaxID=273032 RepID=A0A366XZQ3_9BACI|nr:hypothetical protein [Bacillus taeanensis]RBW69644.1 hypothetical protein DS031_10490 [Bacillus taeanensis]